MEKEIERVLSVFVSVDEKAVEKAIKDWEWREFTPAMKIRPGDGLAY